MNYVKKLKSPNFFWEAFNLAWQGENVVSKEGGNTLTYFLGFKDNPLKKGHNESGTKSAKVKIIASPITGDIVLMKDVKDPVFAQEILGKGVAIDPVGGKVYSPVNGKISVFYETKHAIGIITNEGVELLIHVGIDTVKLLGEHFTAHAKQDDEVKIGDLLLEFDLKAIKKKGYDLTTSIIVTNTNEYEDVEVVAGDYVKASEDLLKVR